jgi:hypothetical protein
MMSLLGTTQVLQNDRYAHWNRTDESATKGRNTSHILYENLESEENKQAAYNRLTRKIRLKHADTKP